MLTLFVASVSVRLRTILPDAGVSSAGWREKDEMTPQGLYFDSQAER